MDKIPEKHASLLTTLVALTLEKLLQSRERGEEFLEPLEDSLHGKYTACTNPEQRKAWYHMLSLVRTWRRGPSEVVNLPVITTQ